MQAINQQGKDTRPVFPVIPHPSGYCYGLTNLHIRGTQTGQRDVEQQPKHLQMDSTQMDRTVYVKLRYTSSCI